MVGDWGAAVEQRYFAGGALGPVSGRLGVWTPCRLNGCSRVASGLSSFSSFGVDGQSGSGGNPSELRGGGSMYGAPSSGVVISSPQAPGIPVAATDDGSP